MDERKKLAYRINAYAFALHEMTLYLDTHPTCKEALHKRMEYRRIWKELIALYEQKFGPYVETANQVQGDCWSWIDGPWPWENGRGC